jgi:hypothetical protein
MLLTFFVFLKFQPCPQPPSLSSTFLPVIKLPPVLELPLCAQSSSLSQHLLCPQTSSLSSNFSPVLNLHSCPKTSFRFSNFFPVLNITPCVQLSSLALEFPPCLQTSTLSSISPCPQPLSVLNPSPVLNFPPCFQPSSLSSNFIPVSALFPRPSSL